ncbi:hypothetical protein MMC19_004699 [Ptychographa xylographoides]|nr:hypothetical protein [Ptychographa xylographoides]
MSNNSLRYDSHAATVEDYSEDTNSTVPGTRQTANIAAKRSKPEISTKVRDEASDSGYSSQTQATAASRGSSAQEPAPERIPMSTTQLPSASQSHLPGAEMATVAAAAVAAVESRKRSPEKPSLFRRFSRSHKKENLRQEAFEGRESAARMRPSGVPVEPSAAPRDTVLERQPRSRPAGPPSPQSSRMPKVLETQPVPISRPLPQTRPRHSQTHGVGSRPASYHAGVTPNIVYMQPQHQPTYAQRGPELPHLNTSVYPGPYVIPSPITYMPAPLQTSPQRQAAYPFLPTTFPVKYQPPPQPQWISDQGPLTSRRASMYSARPIVEYPQAQLYEAVPVYEYAVIPPPSRRLSTHRTERPSPMAPTAESYYLDERDEDYGREEDYYRSMKPPPIPKATILNRQPVQRPPIRHSLSSNTTYLTQRHKDAELQALEFAQKTSGRKLSIDETRPPLRPTTTSRPSATSSRSATTGLHSTQTSPSKEIASTSHPIPRPTRRPVSSYDTADDLERRAEAYQNAKTAAERPNPITVEANDQVVRQRSKTNASHSSGSHSRAGSSRDGSDDKKFKQGPKSSSLDKHRGRSSADVKSRRGDVEDDGFTISIANVRQPMSLGLKGEGVDGRTISINQSQRRDGNVEVHIGGKNSAGAHDGRTREKSVRRYSYAGSGKAVREIGEVEYRQRSKSRATRDRVVETEQQKDYEEGAEEVSVDRLRKVRTGSCSRRSSRSVVSGRNRVEGQQF